MSIFLGELSAQVLELLQKSPGHSGYFTDTKVLRAIQEGFDFCATWMFDAATGGWHDEIRYLDTAAGMASLEMPDDLAILKVLRYKINNLYVPVYYSPDDESPQTDPSDTDGNAPSRFRLLGQKIYFNPPLQEGGSKYLQLEGSYYPPEFQSAMDIIPSKWHRAFRHYIKYRSASILVSGLKDFNRPWAKEEDEWTMVIQAVIDKRVNRTGYIREFEG